MRQIDGNTRLAAVIGKPMKFSLSPFVHNLAFEKTDLNAVYLAWEIGEKNLVQVLHNIRALDMLGVNLSMPYKQLAMWYPEELSDSARLIGAINTIVNKNGKLTGHNTDGIGFFKSLKARHDFLPNNKVVSVIGGGGAAMAIIVEAAFQNAGRIQVFARKSASYAPLEKKLTTVASLTQTDIQLSDLNDEEALQQGIDVSDLLVNASSVGMDGISSPVSENLSLPKRLLTADVIYKTLQTPFLKWAAAQGGITENGLSMMVYQAAEAFKLWTDKTMPVGLIEEELMHKLYYDDV